MDRLILAARTGLPVGFDVSTMLRCICAQSAEPDLMSAARDKIARLRASISRLAEHDQQLRDQASELSRTLAEECRRASVRYQTKSFTLEQAGDEAIYGYVYASDAGMAVAYRHSSDDLEDAHNGVREDLVSYRVSRPDEWSVRWLRLVMTKARLDELIDGLQREVLNAQAQVSSPPLSEGSGRTSTSEENPVSGSDRKPKPGAATPTEGLGDALSRILGFLLQSTGGNPCHWSMLPQNAPPLGDQMSELRAFSQAIAEGTCALTPLQEKAIIESSHESIVSIQPLVSVAFQLSSTHGILWSGISKSVSQLAKLFPFRTESATNTPRRIVAGQDAFSLHFCELIDQLLRWEQAFQLSESGASSSIANESKDYGMGTGANTSMAKNPTTREGDEFPATVIFVLLAGLSDCEDGPMVPNALVHLNKALGDVPSSAYVLSTIAGAIVVIPDTASVQLDQVLEPLANAALGFPLRVGVTHGNVEAVTDIDGESNLIGPPINIAARLATSAKNSGTLVHDSYASYADGSLSAGHWLHRSVRSPLAISGKPQDPEFRCFAGPEAGLPKSPPPPDTVHWQSAVLVAYDLPKFSAGDRAQLRKRFLGLAQVFKRLAHSAAMSSASAMLSPGGDGGVLVLSGLALPDAVSIASRLVELTHVESLDHADTVAVRTRIGVHYGQIAHYINARGVSRPTGLNIFVADQIAGDAHARAKKGIVVTGLIADSATGGSKARLDSEFEQLPALEGRFSSVDRFVRRATASSPARSEAGASSTISLDAPVESTGQEPPTSAGAFEPITTSMVAKKRQPIGAPIAPIVWKLRAVPVPAFQSTKAQLHRAILDAMVESDGGTGRTTRWPAALRSNLVTMETREGGTQLWRSVTNTGVVNVRDEEQLGLERDGTTWFQRALFWDASQVFVEFGQCAFDVVVFLKLVVGGGNALGVRGYDVDLQVQIPDQNTIVTIQSHGLSSTQPSRRARASNTFYESGAVRVNPMTSLPDEVLAKHAKALIDAIANEIALEQGLAHYPDAGPPFLEIEEASLLNLLHKLT